jgi:hypothetical protein
MFLQSVWPSSMSCSSAVQVRRSLPDRMELAFVIGTEPMHAEPLERNALRKSQACLIISRG